MFEPRISLLFTGKAEVHFFVRFAAESQIRDDIFEAVRSGACLVRIGRECEDVVGVPEIGQTGKFSHLAVERNQVHVGEEAGDGGSERDTAISGSDVIALSILKFDSLVQ